MSKNRSSVGDSTIADLHFTICPLLISTEAALDRKCIYYFGKGLQVIGQFQVEPSGGQSLQNHIDPLTHQISFRVQSDKFAEYIWSVYDVVETEEGEIEDILEEVKISIKPFWDNYLEKKNKIQEGSVNFVNSKIKLAYLFCIAQESKIDQQIMKYLRKSKGLSSQPSINQQKKQVQVLQGLEPLKSQIQQIPINATSQEYQPQNQQQSQQIQQIESSEATFVITPIQTQNIQPQAEKQQKNQIKNQQHVIHQVDQADEHREHQPNQHPDNMQEVVPQSNIFGDFIMPIITIHQVFDPEDEQIEQNKEQVQQEQAPQDSSSPVKKLNKDYQHADQEVTIPQKIIQIANQVENPSNQGEKPSSSQNADPYTDFIASNPLQFLLGPLKKVFPPEARGQQQIENKPSQVVEDVYEIKNVPEVQNAQVEECQEVRLQELQNQITTQQGNQQEIKEDIHTSPAAQNINDDNANNEANEQSHGQPNEPSNEQLNQQSKEPANQPVNQPSQKQNPIKDTQAHAHSPHKTPAKSSIQKIPTIDLSKLKRAQEQSQYSHSQRKAADQVQKDVEQALSENKEQIKISKIEDDVQLFSQITERQPSITLTRSALYDSEGNRLHPGTQMPYKNIVLLAIVLIFFCFAGYFVNKMINNNLIKEDKKQKPPNGKKEKKTKKKSSNKK